MSRLAEYKENKKRMFRVRNILFFGLFSVYLYVIMYKYTNFNGGSFGVKSIDNLYSIKKRMARANMIVSLAPLVSTVIAVFVAVVIVWICLIEGMSFGTKDEASFNRTCQTIKLVVEEDMRYGRGTSNLDKIVKKNGISMRIMNGNDVFYENIDEDLNLLSNGISTYTSSISFGEETYFLYLYANTKNEVENSLATVLFVIIAVLIICPIFTYILTNRFITGYVYSGIEKYFDELIEATGQIENGNLSYRMAPPRVSEFTKVTDSFNEMSKRLENADETMKNRFEKEKMMVRDISHDIKSPLASMVFLANAIKEGIVKDKETEAEYLNNMLDKAFEIDRLLAAILSRFRLEATDEESLHAISLKNCIEKYLDEHKGEYEKRGVHFICSLSDISILGDEEMINTILDNLISNSLKYRIKDESKIIISLEYSEDNKCTLTVKDDGPGVAQENLERILEPFFRCDKSRTNPESGNGLGLSIVKTAVEKQGGEIRMKNENGLKAEITFSQGN